MGLAVSTLLSPALLNDSTVESAGAGPSPSHCHPSSHSSLFIGCDSTRLKRRKHLHHMTERGAQEEWATARISMEMDWTEFGRHLAH